MAEKETPTAKPVTATHTEPMTTEMIAAVDANSGGDQKPAEKPVKKAVPKKKAAVKKKAAPKKKSVAKKKAAVKKSSVTKKKAAPKKKVAAKKKSAVKKKAAPTKSNEVKTTTTAAATTAAKQTQNPVENKPEAQPAEKVAEKVDTPTATAAPAEPATPSEAGTAAEAAPKETVKPAPSIEEREHQQQIRQKLVDLGVADADEIGAVASEEPQESSGPFWIKAMVALLVIVGLYFYSKESNNVSSVQIASQPVVAPLESHPPVADEPKVDEAAPSEGEVSDEPLSESTPPETLATPGISVAKEDATITASQLPDTQPESEPTQTATQQTAENGDNDEKVATAPASEPAVTTEQMQGQYIPGYVYPNPWNPNYYPPFNAMNQVAPINPYNYPPINMVPGMVPPPYYGYPQAPY